MYFSDLLKVGLLFHGYSDDGYYERKNEWGILDA